MMDVDARTTIETSGGPTAEVPEDLRGVAVHAASNGVMTPRLEVPLGGSAAGGLALITMTAVNAAQRAARASGLTLIVDHKATEAQDRSNDPRDVKVHEAGESAESPHVMGNARTMASLAVSGTAASLGVTIEDVMIEGAAGASTVGGTNVKDLDGTVLVLIVVIEQGQAVVARALQVRIAKVRTVAVLIVTVLIATVRVVHARVSVALTAMRTATVETARGVKAVTVIATIHEGIVAQSESLKTGGVTIASAAPNHVTLVRTGSRLAVGTHAVLPQILVVVTTLLMATLAAVLTAGKHALTPPDERSTRGICVERTAPIASDLLKLITTSPALSWTE